MENRELTPNELTVVALCNEYCYAVEHCREAEPDEFVKTMLRLLPRLYIATTDIKTEDILDDDVPYIENVLDEDYYESLRHGIGDLLGPDDTYLEVFEEDMKYSDTPIAASISEGLCDIFQSLYNFLETVRDAPTEFVHASLIALQEDFRFYWSSTLCNNLRALNHLRYNADRDSLL